MHVPEHVAERRTGWRSWLDGTPLGWGSTLALAALGVYLSATHAGHVLSALPYLLLLMCPLMHLFGHGGHGHGHGGHDRR
jgi:hypothetical protein